MKPKVENPRFSQQKRLPLTYLFALFFSVSLMAQETDPVAGEADLFADEENAYASPPEVPDPLEGFNRFMFKFNDVAYGVVLRPVARTYTRVMPDPVESGLSNFFDNLAYPIRLTGALLQGNSEKINQETGKFLLNTTAGLGGFLKPSDKYESSQLPEEDMKQTLGYYGLDNGFYLVLPILGPTTLRDFAGDMVDGAILDPVNWFNDWEVRLSLQVTDTVNRLPRTIMIYDEMKKGALDPYSSMKDAYLQRIQLEIER